jgi:hypothetical protein
LHPTKAGYDYYLLLIRRKKRSPICAAAIFAAYREPSARTCLSYAVIQISIASSSEFSRRSVGSENSGDKKTKQKAARRVRLFWLLFWRSKKVACSRQHRQC